MEASNDHAARISVVFLTWVFQKCRNENIEVSPVCWGRFSKLHSGCEHHYDCSSSLPRDIWKTPFVTCRYPLFFQHVIARVLHLHHMKKNFGNLFLNKICKIAIASSYQRFCAKPKKNTAPSGLHQWRARITNSFCSIQGTNGIFTY